MRNQSRKFQAQQVRPKLSETARRTARRVVATVTAILLAAGSLLPGAAATASAARPAPWEPHLEIEAKPGTQRSLASMRIFYPLSQSDDSLLYADLRGVLSNDPSREGNIGIGFRRILSSRSAIFGAYAFYDVRRTASGNTWRQGTAGLELLGTDWETRVNAYLPEEGKKPAGESFFSGFVVKGTTLVYQDAHIDNYETAMRGFDVEIGRRVASAGGDTRVYLAGFHFTAPEVSDVTGARLGIETRQAGLFSRWPYLELAAGAEVQADNVRGTQAFLNLGVRIPFGPGQAPVSGEASGQAIDPAGGALGGSAGPGGSDLRNRMTATVRRDVDVVTQTIEERQVVFEETPIAPSTGEPVGRLWFFAAGGTGDGSEHNPTSVSVVQEESSPGDMLIAVGDGGPIHTGDGGLVLQPGQTLTSAGGQVWLEVPGKGLIAYTPAGRPGVLTNDADTDIVTLTWLNTVSGARFSGGRSAIAAAFSDGDAGWHVILGNEITGTRGSAVAMTTEPGAEASLLLLEISGNRISGAGSSAIFLDLSAGTVEANVRDNTISGTDNSAVSIQAYTSQPGQVLRLSVSGNDIDGSDAEGIALMAEGPAVDVRVEDNAVRNTEGPAIAVQASGFAAAGADVAALLSGNIIENAGSAGIFAFVQAHGDNAAATLQAFHNDVDTVRDTGRTPDGDVYGIFAGAASAGSVSVHVEGNTAYAVSSADSIEDSQVVGIGITATAGGSAHVSAADNGVHGVAAGGEHGTAVGVQAIVQAGEDVSVALGGNVVEGVHALEAAGSDRTTVTGLGAVVIGSDDTRASIDITGNQVLDLKGTTSPKGITALVPAGVSSAAVNVSNNTISFMSGTTTTDGILIGLLQVTDASVTASGNGISFLTSGTDAAGIKLVGLGSEDTGQFVVEASGNMIGGLRGCQEPQAACSSSPGDDPLYTTGIDIGVALPAGGATVLVQDNVVQDLDNSASGVNGLHLRTESSGRAQFTIAGNTVSGLGGEWSTAALVESRSRETAVAAIDNDMSALPGIALGLDVTLNPWGGLDHAAAVEIRGNDLQQFSTGVRISNSDLVTTEALIEANTITADEVGVYLSTPEGDLSLMEATVTGNQIDAPTPVETVGNVICTGADCP